MSNQIRIKRRAATGAAGAPSALKNAELAFNENDKTLYYGFGDDGSANATSIIPIGGPGAFTDLSSAQTIAGAKAFTTSPTAPTPTAGDSTTKVATTAFVTQAVGGSGGTQAANSVYAGPSSGANAAPSFRSLVVNDIPTLTAAKLSDFSTQVNAIISALKNAASGLAPLDSNSLIPLANIPASIRQGLNFVSTLAATGSLPASPTIGQFWIISSPGTFTSTTHALKVGDWIVYNGEAGGDLATGWDYIDNSVVVTSVFGRVGAITAQSGDYVSDQVTEGTTNLFFTTARAQTAAVVNSMAGSQTAQAPSVASVQSYVANVSVDGGVY